MSFRTRSSLTRYAAPLGLAAVLCLASAPLCAGAGTDRPAAQDDAADALTTGAVDTMSADEPFPARASVRALIEKEVAKEIGKEIGKTRLPADIAEAVVFVESRYDSSVIGRAGEIGLMQVMPETAAMLGFKGTTTELAKPEINIRYGVTYLAKAWRLAQGDLCKALMKYRAGHGEETMTARSVIYCNRARNRLMAMNSPFATPGAVAAMTAEPPPASAPALAKAQETRTQGPRVPGRPTDVYAVYRHGTAAASRAFWAAHEARIRTINARIEAKWRRVASR
jgi:hypothetical protein